MRSGIHAATLLACASLLLVSCSTAAPSTPAPVTADPSSVAGLPAINGPNGVRNLTFEPERKVTGTDGGEIDLLAAGSITDIEEFWQGGAYSQAFDEEFTPIGELISWDSRSKKKQFFCDQPTYKFYNAAWCSDNTIGWDRGGLMPDIRNANGDIAITGVLAHEQGHSVQWQSKLAGRSTPVVVREQQADCFTGAYMRWVADGNSTRFVVSTSDGLNNVMAALISVRDEVVIEAKADPKTEHGSAFDRVAAFQYGFEDGVEACKDINERELYQRRADLPQFLTDDDDTGQMDLTEESLRLVVDALNVVESPPNPPALSFDREKCPDSLSTAAAIYCPSTNTIIADLPALDAMATEKSPQGLAYGDNTAFSVVMSRYVMALEKDRGVELDGTQAALRTACLTGTVTTKFVEPINTPDGGKVWLSAGDLDEAVSGLLTYGVVASDVNGVPVPSGFASIEAFREGVLGNADHCYELFA